MNRRRGEIVVVPYDIEVSYRHNGQRVQTRVGHELGLELLTRYDIDGVIPSDIMRSRLLIRVIKGNGRIDRVIFKDEKGGEEYTIPLKDYIENNYPCKIVLGERPPRPVLRWG